MLLLQLCLRRRTSVLLLGCRILILESFAGRLVDSHVLRLITRVILVQLLLLLLLLQSLLQQMQEISSEAVSVIASDAEAVIRDPASLGAEWTCWHLMLSRVLLLLQVVVVVRRDCRRRTFHLESSRGIRI